MNFDLAKTMQLVKGGLMDHEATWSGYLEQNKSWQETTVLLTGPLILANVVLGLIFSRLIGGYAAYGIGQNFFVALIIALVLTVIGFVITVLVFNFLAGIFGGTPNFSRTFAAISLAGIPTWLAGIVAALVPGIGFLVALAGGIISLVFLYKILPLAVQVPGPKRVLHFVVSLVIILIINMIIGAVFVRDSINAQLQDRGMSESRSTTASGVLGDMEYQGRLMDEAMADEYDPPMDGKLTEEQVETYASVQRKTRDLAKERMEKMAKISADFEASREDQDTMPSATELAQIYSGVGAAMSANNAEMEVVKTGGGNWAEHQWVKQQLRIARIQQGEGSDANEHNYELYQEFEDDIEGE